MPDKKFRDKNTRKLTRMGRKSIGLTLPIELLAELKWKERQKVTVRKIRGGLVIRDWKSK